MKPAAKSDHKRLVQQVCHPEPFGFAQDKLREGSRGQILRCAQNDTSEQLRRKVYQCRVFRFRRRHKKSPVCIPHSALRIPPAWLWWWTGLPLVLWTLTTPSASAQVGGAGGWVIQLYGMVQVEPGANVLTLGVKNEEIRFVVHDVRCANGECSTGRFLSDVTRRTPGVYVKGPDAMLDILIKEKPSKRVLKLSGLYYPDSRMFVLNGLEPFQEKSRREF